MKKFLILLGLTALIGCNESANLDPNKPGLGDGVGRMSLALSPEGDITLIENKAVDNSVNLKSFAINIKDGKGQSYAKYSSYAEVPDAVELVAGQYTIEASSGQLLSAAFDMPHYAGLSTFKIEAGQVAEVKVPCVITNVKVTVEYSAKMLSALKDVSVNVISAYDAADVSKVGQLDFTPAETRAGWFAKPADKKLKIYVTATNINTNKFVSFDRTLDNVEPRQWRKVAIDVKTSGGVGVEITVDETLIEKPDSDVVIPDTDDVIDNNGDNGNWDESDNPVDPPATSVPTIVGIALGNADGSSAFDIEEVIDFEEGFNILDVEMGSTATGGIQNLFLTIESASLADILEPALGITGEIDLANPVDGSTWKEMFESKDIALLDPAVPIKGKSKHTFSVGNLMSLLIAVGGKGQEHNFHLRLIDANGESAKTLTINLL